MSIVASVVVAEGREKKGSEGIGSNGAPHDENRCSG